MNEGTQIPRCHFHLRIPGSHKVHVEAQEDVNLKYKFKTSYLLNCKTVYTIPTCINSTNFAALYTLAGLICPDSTVLPYVKLYFSSLLRVIT
jgi:hypothetical protein